MDLATNGQVLKY